MAGRLRAAAWLSLLAGSICAAIATALYFTYRTASVPDSMTVTVTSKGKPVRYHLGCRPTSGSLPDASAACNAMRYLFAQHSASGFEVLSGRRCGHGPLVKVTGRYSSEPLDDTVDLSCPMTSWQRAFWARVGGFRARDRLPPFRARPHR